MDGNPNESSHTYCPRCAAMIYKEGAEQRGKKLAKEIIERLKSGIRTEQDEKWEGDDLLKDEYRDKYLSFYQELLNEIQLEAEGSMR